MQKIKENKGITLIILVLTIVIMLILIVPISVNLIEVSNIKELSKIKTDFKVIEEAISQVSNDNSLEIGPVFSGNVNMGNQKNVNDGNVYYVINMELLEELYLRVSGVQMDELNYGSNNYNIAEGTTTYDNGDIFIMNKDTHTVYYLSKKNNQNYYIGYEYKNNIYYRF